MNLVYPQQRDPEAGVTPPHFLDQVDQLLDWKVLSEVMDNAGRRLGVDRPIPRSALKIALLKHWYGLADTALAFEVLDRLSFRAFVGYLGDDNGPDHAIQDELREGFWAQQPEMALLVEAVELHLRDLGYSVRAGRLVSASLMPCTESGENAPKASSETELFRPGELGRMVEAVTAKAYAQGRLPAGSQVPAEPAAVSADFPAPGEAGGKQASEMAGETEMQDGRIRAVLDWPWGVKSELTEHLEIGREHGFSPLARELTPYTHVSRRHAELLVYGDGVWIRDLGSRNGTYVNNDEVPKGQAYLIDSDSIIRFGPLLAVPLKILP